MWLQVPQPLKDSLLSSHILPSSFDCPALKTISCWLQVQAPLLPYPNLTYADTSRRTDKSGSWSPAKFYRPGNMESYAFASFTPPMMAQNLKVRQTGCQPGAGCIMEASFSNMCRPRDNQCGTSCMPLLAQGPLSTHCCASRKLLPACLCVARNHSRCEVALHLSLCLHHTAAVALLHWCLTLKRAEGDALLNLLLPIALQTFIVLLLRDCRDFGIGNVPGPSLGIPLVFHQNQDTTEDTLRKAVAAAKQVFGRGKPSIIFVCLPQAGELLDLPAETDRCVRLGLLQDLPC